MGKELGAGRHSRRTVHFRYQRLQLLASLAPELPRAASQRVDDLVYVLLNLPDYVLLMVLAYLHDRLQHVSLVVTFPHSLITSLISHRSLVRIWLLPHDLISGISSFSNVIRRILLEVPFLLPKESFQ